MFARFAPSLTLMVAAFALPSATLTAAPVEETVPTVTVSFADLDLGAPAGAAALKARVAAAAKSVCGVAETRDLKAMSRVETCRTAALAKAAPQIEVAMAKAQDNQRYAQASTSNRTSAR
jgi:UrcA family protein